MINREDVEICGRCGKALRVAAPAHPCARGINAPLRVIASIEEPALIGRILTDMRSKRENSEAPLGPPSGWSQLYPSLTALVADQFAR